MTLEQLIGFWLVVGALAGVTGTALLVAVGLAVVMNRKDDDRGGCRGRGCRHDAGRQGCTKPGAVDGPAAHDLATLARVGWVDLDTVRKTESK